MSKRNEYDKEYYALNKAKIAERKRLHRLNNPELYKQRDKLYSLKAKNKNIEIKKQYSTNQWKEIKLAQKLQKIEEEEQTKLEVKMLKKAERAAEAAKLKALKQNTIFAKRRALLKAAKAVETQAAT